ncbi:MAG: DNA polymerase III subunit epsilon [Proteobacteria bacterium]|jgi:DNA polymerase III subunit epsilon|nr:DNA polymerase III subunit epsilon [Pseudomonadota bacterium]
MKLRQIVLDTETTGLDPRQGHKMIEIGCIELIDRKLTGNNLHFYVNPEREIDAGAVAVHGITSEFLNDKPLFQDVAEDLLTYLKGSEVIIHNAPFDVGFLDNEFHQCIEDYDSLSSYCEIFDTLVQARQLHPGQRNDLDSLCKRYEVDNSNRDLHGGLLDAEILAEVYLRMSGGQTSLTLGEELSAVSDDNTKEFAAASRPDGVLPVIKANTVELKSHIEWVDRLEQASGEDSVWRKLQQ